MPSPFPGMDPYLEGRYWEDFHARVIPEIASAVGATVRPRYVALIGQRVYVERVEGGPGLYLPDVSVHRSGARGSQGVGGGGTALLAPPQEAAALMPLRIVEYFVEVRTRDDRELVATVEVLSPSNKRAGSTGRREYLAKRAERLLTDVPLVELDLLRAGERLPMVPPLAGSDYYALVGRGNRRPRTGVWPFRVRDPLPVIPVPLRGDDPDVALDLQAVFTRVYDAAGYDYTLDYTAEPEPPLAPEEAAWAREVLARRAG